MISLSINGTAVNVDVDPTTPLLWVLRDVLGLTGTKYGCGVEICGACTVMINGEAEKSCHIEIKECVGKAITTIEGLSPDGSHPLQKAWIAEQVPQCGYCQSGMIMAAACKMREKGRLTASDAASIKNICVCGTYERIRSAIVKASQ